MWINLKATIILNQTTELWDNEFNHEAHEASLAVCRCFVSFVASW